MISNKLKKHMCVNIKKNLYIILFFQLRFLISQGIDHLVTLSSDKLPPYYAFPELKWTLIPVEDFTGPTISEIKKFISIIDEARRNGEVGLKHRDRGYT